MLESKPIIPSKRVASSYTVRWVNRNGDVWSNLVTDMKNLQDFINIVYYDGGRIISIREFK